MDMAAFKMKQLEQVAEYRRELQSSPRLTWLFFEVTDRCSLRCAHCGSSCGPRGQDLDPSLIEKVLEDVRGHGLRPMVCLTGGEPLLYPHLYSAAETIRGLGFDWGMTTNGYGLTRETAQKLRECGMATVSVSIDGFERQHDALRGRKGAWRRAVDAVGSLQRAGFAPQVTSVFHRGNIGAIEPFFRFLCGIGVTDWRAVNVEPIGRAAGRGDLLLKREELLRLLGFIREKRFDPSCPMRVAYGCSHFLGPQWERTVRDHYFFCGAGLQIASVRCSGDICACLDIEDDPSLVQGNAKADRFTDVWFGRFEAFQRDRSADSAACGDCAYRHVCAGDSAHTWDFREKKPRLCAARLIENA